MSMTNVDRSTRLQAAGTPVTHCGGGPNVTTGLVRAPTDRRWRRQGERSAPETVGLSEPRIGSRLAGERVGGTPKRLGLPKSKSATGLTGSRPDHPQRRRHVRVSTQQAVDYWIVDEREKQVGPGHYHGVANDISVDGMQLQGCFPESLAPAPRFRFVLVCLELSLPNVDERISAIARVAWVSPPVGRSEQSRMGLQFEEITAGGRDKLAEFVIMRRLQACKANAEVRYQ